MLEQQIDDLLKFLTYYLAVEYSVINWSKKLAVDDYKRIFNNDLVELVHDDNLAYEFERDLNQAFDQIDQLIKDNLSLALTSPSEYVREYAKLIYEDLKCQK